MRILVGRFSAESNSFAPQKAGDEDFRVHEGEELLRLHQGSQNTEISGFLDTLMLQQDVEVVPSVDAKALPNGPVKRATYEKIKDLFLKSLTSAGRIDGVLLALHGAMEVEGLGDGEGDFLETLRGCCGPDIPIIVTLDLHAVVTKKMVENATAFVGYRTAPHTDMYQVGVQAAELLLQLLNGKTSCAMAFQKLPMLIQGEKAESSTEPMKSLLGRMNDLQCGNDILSTSLFIGNAWIDDVESGVSVVAVAKTLATAELATEIMAQEVWKRRYEFAYPSYAKVLEPDPAIDAALEACRAKKAPVIMVDSGDNPTAGAPGDSTFLLHKVLDAGIPTATVISIVDPEALAACVEAGIGKELTLTLGGKLDRSAPPINIKCSVESIMGANTYTAYDLGVKSRAAVVRVQDTHIEIIVVEKRVDNTDPRFPRSLGIEPVQRDLLIIKDSYCTDEYRKMAQEWLLVLTPGTTQQMLHTLRYRKVRRPIFPLDEDVPAKW